MRIGDAAQNQKIITTKHMNAYDIILINLDFPLGNIRNSFNVGLATIEAFLTLHGIRCRTIHGSEIDQYLDQADVFGISVMDHTYEIARNVTQHLAEKTIIWGGWTATALPEFILNEHPGVDYVILQEGEQRLLMLLKSFEQPALFDQIDGIAYRNEQHEILIRPPRTFLNLDELPIPTTLAVLDQLVFVELARGCYGGCRYCQEVTKMRFKSVPRAVAEIRHWYDQGYRYFYLGNANSIANGPLLKELVAELEVRDLPIKIFLTGRPGDVLRNYDVLSTIFRSPVIHLHSIEVGVEANTQTMLDLLGRRTTPEMNRQAISALLDLRTKYSPDTLIYANIILFTHFDMTLADFLENVRFIGDYQCSREVVALQLYGVANTPLWFEMKARGFPLQANRGLQITDYPFTDKVVDRLFKKLVQTPLQQLRQKKFFSFSDQFEFQRHCHDQLLEFYHAPNMLESVMNFLKT
jgi:radical SAM superfamily enzyme YgiQ (UPF0313 family)